MISGSAAERAISEQTAASALRMQAAGDNDKPEDVFFSVKQRLQKCNVWLIGMDGCDKHIVGQQLAKKLVRRAEKFERSICSNNRRHLQHASVNGAQRPRADVCVHMHFYI